MRNYCQLVERNSPCCCVWAPLLPRQKASSITSYIQYYIIQYYIMVGRRSVLQLTLQVLIDKCLPVDDAGGMIASPCSCPTPNIKSI